MPEWLAPDPGLRKELEERIYQLRAEPHPSSHYAQDERRALDHPLVTIAREEEFERDRRLGISIVQPYLDSDVVDLLTRIRPEVLNGGGRTKGLVRGMLQRRFPELGFDRQKKVGATSMVRDTVGREAGRALEAAGGVNALGQLGVVDPGQFSEEVGRVIADPRHRKINHFRVLETLNTEVWVRSRL